MSGDIDVMVRVTYQIDSANTTYQYPIQAKAMELKQAKAFVGRKGTKIHKIEMSGGWVSLTIDQAKGVKGSEPNVFKVRVYQKRYQRFNVSWANTNDELRKLINRLNGHQDMEIDSIKCVAGWLDLTKEELLNNY